MDGDASTAVSPSPSQSTPLPHFAASTPGPSAPHTPHGPPSPVKDVKPELDRQPEPSHGAGCHVSVEAGPSLRRKRKIEATRYTPAEAAEIEARAAAIDYAVALDQHDTLYADQTRFAGFEDVVDRLLPWHVWQVPEEELVLPSEERAKEQLTSASGQVANLIDLRRRFAKVRRREGTHPSDLPSLIYMLRESTADVRDELAAVQASLRVAKGKHEVQLAEERRVREAAAHKERMRLDDIERQRRAQFLAQAQALARQQAAHHVAQGQALPLAPTLASPAAAPNSVSPAALPRPPVPVTGSASFTPAFPIASSSTPAVFDAPGTPAADSGSGIAAAVRGRPRGRPRGSGRGGTRPPTTTHIKAPAAKKTTSPVQITVAMSLIPAFVSAALLILPNPQNLKAPATIIRTSDDKKNVTLSIDLGTCTQPQLQTLARLLNVQAKLPGANASGSSTPNGTSAPASPARTSSSTAAQSAGTSAPTTHSMASSAAPSAVASASASPAPAPPTTQSSK
ncbi:hypothetical protein CC85DRAFT_284101 [Cutaneotrichosporon oleaginosum]|uniref:GLTSCR protein conserved domain-containing protein n=1 Tax=Cutaneotrichosporon oleaginosum TaxID=879819 RepID=A0A0J1B7S5_9TREE|nr:uncharacterized protein CC85DRAFT_284101 [Cutaneotrichosporon oleaginosum]KLT43814.1 hypothetical protein CC85DRAFT_284101 [Cutaneotrichosporon oleaginosum]TXT06444.1 hypothetical protein COLE_05775 [Cutaneotrichosporon oleaginosum]